MFAKKCISILFLVAFSFTLDTSSPLLAKLHALPLTQYFTDATFYSKNEAKVLPGQVIMILVENKKKQLETQSLAVQLLNPKYDLLVTVPLLLYVESQYYAFLPIPHTATSGTYQYRLIQNDGQLDKQNVVLHTNNIRVGERTFQIEKVALTKRLAKRKSSPAAPKVVQESKEIWALTKSMNEDNIFAFENFILPLKDYKYVSGMFADQRTYTYMDGQTINGTVHGGIDIAAPRHTPVHLSAAGKVVLAKERVVTGFSVVVEHFPGLYSMYYHLHTINVAVGDLLSIGDVVGTVGSTGFSTGNHLHWEIRVNNIRVDPILFLERLDKRIIKL